MSVILTEQDVEGLYGSSKMSGADLGDRKIRATISHTRIETLPARGTEPARTKLVLTFAEHKKRVGAERDQLRHLARCNQPQSRRVARRGNRYQRGEYELRRQARKGTAGEGAQAARGCRSSRSGCCRSGDG